MRSLTDARLRESNEEYLQRKFGDSPFAILVRVPLLEGHAMTPDFNSAGCVLHRWPAAH